MGALRRNQKDTAMRIFFAIVGAIALIALVVFGGWKLGWWFQSQNIDLQNQVNHQSQQYQDGLAAELRNDVQGWNAATDAGQKTQIASTFCAQYQDITHPEFYPDLTQARAQICH